jgi:hypothetical protein
MGKPSVLLIGGSGAIGKPLLDELKRQEALLLRLAVLTAPSRSIRFAKDDVEVITGSFYDQTTYKGQLDYEESQQFEVCS